MADEQVKAGVVVRTRTYVSDVIAEMRRVTWPDKAQVRQLSIGVIVLSLAIGAVIGIMDVVLQNVLQRLVPGLFGAA